MTAVKRCGSGDQPPSADRLAPACRVATRVHAPSEPVQCLFAAALGRNRDELVAKARRTGCPPVQATWTPNRPISAQPEGQMPFRAVCGVANPRHSAAMAAVCALHPIPKRHLRDGEKTLNRLSGRAAGKRLRLLLPPPLGEGWGGGRRRFRWERRWPPSPPSPRGGRRRRPSLAGGGLSEGRRRKNVHT